MTAEERLRNLVTRHNGSLSLHYTMKARGDGEGPNPLWEAIIKLDIDDIGGIYAKVVNVQAESFDEMLDRLRTDLDVVVRVRRKQLLDQLDTLDPLQGA